MAGITVPIVAVTGEPDAVNNFTRALMRTQQTTLGIVVYSLVSGLIWPTSSRSEFEGAARMLIENQRQLLACYMAQLTGGSGDPLGEDGAAQLRGEVTRALGGLHTRLDHAELDTYEVWEVRYAWRRFIAQLGALNGTMEALRQTLHELNGLDAQRYIRSLPALGAELDNRFAAIEGMLDGHAPAHQPVELACEHDREQLAERSHFEQSAVMLAVSQLTQLERETRALDGAIQARGLGGGPAGGRAGQHVQVAGAGPGHRPAGAQRPDGYADKGGRRAPIRSHGARVARGGAQLAGRCAGHLRATGRRAVGGGWRGLPQAPRLA
jgi:hypothetical protein